jgi:uncharacterized protein YpmB
MRKEVILAVIIGVILGGVILYGINMANNAAAPVQTDSRTTETDDTSSTDTPKEQNSTSFIYPQDHAVITESKITLKGVTKPNSNIAIITEADNIITTSDSDGNYSSPINLINGENTISVTIVDPTLSTSSASITVIYTQNIPE